MNASEWFQQPSGSVYKPCPCCGGREVVKTSTACDKPGREGVIVECKFCDRRRGYYTRKRKAGT